MNIVKVFIYDHIALHVGSNAEIIVGINVEDAIESSYEYMVVSVAETIVDSIGAFAPVMFGHVDCSWLVGYGELVDCGELVEHTDVVEYTADIVYCVEPANYCNSTKSVYHLPLRKTPLHFVESSS